MLLQNRYRITQKIGSGTYSDVYEAEHVFKNTKVAVKLNKYNDEVSIKLIEHEIKIYLLLKKHNMENVVGIKSFGVFKEYNYIIMEYLPFTMDIYLKNNRDKIITFYNYIRKILNNLHEINIVHRDIKPDNFMVNAYGNVFLIDLGMACEINPNQPLHKMVGTIDYCSFRVHEKHPYEPFDDRIAMYYMFFELYSNNRLPWSGLYLKNRDKHDEVIYMIKKYTDFILYYKNLGIETSFMITIIDDYNKDIKFNQHKSCLNSV